MCDMSQTERDRLSIPTGGRWFWRQQDMLNVYQEQGGITLAWAKENGANAYGVYPGAGKSELMSFLLANPPEKRWAFELIPRTASCKAYMDMEWTATPDPEHTGLSKIIASVRERCKETFSIEPEIYVCCGSRPNKADAELVDHSYHAVIENLVFRCNHDKDMKRFFTFDNPELYVPDGSPTGKYMIDLAVYTPNRVFRLPLNCKYGRNVPFRRISGDPYEDDFTHDWGEDIDAVLPFFLVDPERRGGTKFIETPPVEQAAPENQENTVVGPRKRARTSDDTRPPPFPLRVLQDMLVSAGDTVSVPTGSTWIDHEEAWQVQCNQGRNARKCMINKEKTHDSNNCILFVTKFQRRLKVKYHCTSMGCSGCTNIILGYVSMDSELEWQHELSSQLVFMESPNAIPDAMQVDEDIPDNTSLSGAESVASFGAVSVAQSIGRLNDPDNPELNTYLLVKARFEQECFKVEIPFCYARVKKGMEHDPSIFSHTEVKQFFCHLSYWKLDERGSLKKVSFIDEWLKDPFKKNVDAIVVDPAGTQVNVYNMWKGFVAASLPPVDTERIPELIKPILRHMDAVITKGNQEHTDWMLDYLANMVKRPEKKSQVAISLYGPQGCGKGMLFEFFRLKVLGSHCSYQTANPESCLFGRFANGAVNRVCIQIDEVRSLHEYHDQLKDFITNPTLNYERKGKDKIVLNNIANLILTSNNANVLTVSPDDRRFVLFECNPLYLRDKEYKDELGAHLERPEVARAFYQHLLTRDLSKYSYSFQHSRPITDYYKTSQQNSIPVVSRFFSALINGDCPESLKGRELYQRYERFHAAGNYKFMMTETAFGRETIKINGITRSRNTAGKYYTFNAIEIKKFLETTNEYDQDAEYPY